MIQIMSNLQIVLSVWVNIPSYQEHHFRGTDNLLLTRAVSVGVCCECTGEALCFTHLKCFQVALGVNKVDMYCAMSLWGFLSFGRLLLPFEYRLSQNYMCFIISY